MSVAAARPDGAALADEHEIAAGRQAKRAVLAAIVRRADAAAARRAERALAGHGVVAKPQDPHVHARHGPASQVAHDAGDDAAMRDRHREIRDRVAVFDDDGRAGPVGPRRAVAASQIAVLERLQLEPASGQSAKNECAAVVGGRRLPWRLPATLVSVTRTRRAGCFGAPPRIPCRTSTRCPSRPARCRASAARAPQPRRTRSRCKYHLMAACHRIAFRRGRASSAYRSRQPSVSSPARERLEPFRILPAVGLSRRSRSRSSRRPAGARTCRRPSATSMRSSGCAGRAVARPAAVDRRETRARRVRAGGAARVPHHAGHSRRPIRVGHYERRRVRLQVEDAVGDVLAVQRDRLHEPAAELGAAGRCIGHRRQRWRTTASRLA